MNHPFIDADVVIRWITGDDPAKQDAVGRLFDLVDRGELALQTPVTTIADCLHVLTSRRLYHIPRTEVAEILAALIGRPGLHVPDREVVLRALDLYGTINIDFGDAMIVAATESTRQQVVYSYDRDFDRFSGIDRREP